MDITPLIRSDQQVIQSYSSGVFKVSSVSYDHPVLVTPDNTVRWVVPFDDMTDLGKELHIDHFAQIIAQASEIDLVLLGCGRTMFMMNHDLRAALKEHGIIVDVMDTGAACRTYNVLMAEGRRLIAALYPVS